MANKSDLPVWVLEALENLDGRGTVVEVSRSIWQAHEQDLRDAGDLFYTWQYDVRWAAQKLRDAGSLQPATKGPQGGWALAR